MNLTTPRFCLSLRQVSEMSRTEGRLLVRVDKQGCPPFVSDVREEDAVHTHSPPLTLLPPPPPRGIRTLASPACLRGEVIGRTCLPPFPLVPSPPPPFAFELPYPLQQGTTQKRNAARWASGIKSMLLILYL